MPHTVLYLHITLSRFMFNFFRLVHITSLLLLCKFTFAQPAVSPVANLPNTLQESSGLLFINHTLFTHNDSGGEPALHSIDTGNGTLLRTVYIGNATNRDWEDISADASYTYIADIGNNNGSRQDLRIYKIANHQLFVNGQDTIFADTISFSYSDQTNFAPNPRATNFDAEALIVKRDSLYIFTKNWLNGRTNVYKLPKTAGSYIAEKTDSINTQGFITGADYDSTSNSLVLTGYNILLQPFIVYFPSVAFPLSQQSFSKYSILSGSSYSGQVEAICSAGSQQYYMSSEASLGKPASLFSVMMNGGIGISEEDLYQPMVFPNPADNILHINCTEWIKGEIFNSLGKEVLQFTNTTIDVSQLPEGIYGIILYRDGSAFVSGKFKVFR